MRNRESYINYKEISSKPSDPEPVGDLATNEKVKELTGVVSGCDVLNVRSEPRNDVDNVVDTFAQGDTVKIFDNDSTDEYYYVQLDKFKSMEMRDTKGYVMKKYITLN